jgi:REP element-mobilizing transposase RayT
MPLSDDRPDYLRRLPKGWYTGYAWVHWTMTIDGRTRGWLDELMHRHVRELLVHTTTRHGLVCPAYCLMPDHAHFLWLGTMPTSDQNQASAFFRRYWNQALEQRGASLQKQPHDHVLNEHERNPEAFEEVFFYVLRNAEAAGLTGDWREWPFVGAAAAGYPDTDPREEDWLGRFWKIYHTEVRRHGKMEG